MNEKLIMQELVIPTPQAKKLCPELVIVPTNFPKYTEVSRQVQKVFADYDPEFSAASLDEAYLDITNFLDARRDAGMEMTASEAVEEMRRRIFESTQLTASAGIAPNGSLKMLFQIFLYLSLTNKNVLLK